MAEALLINRTDLVKHTSLNGNIDTDTFIQYVKIAQEIHIANYLGTDLFNKLKADIVANTLSGNYLTLLTTYVKPMLIHWAMVEWLQFASYTINGKGIFKHSSENASNVDKNEIDFLIDKETSLAQHYTERFVRYMSFNQTSFPEYNSNSNDDTFPDHDTNFTSWLI
jgi:hypothetical protein